MGMFKFDHAKALEIKDKLHNLGVFEIAGAIDLSREITIEIGAALPVGMLFRYGLCYYEVGYDMPRIRGAGEYQAELLFSGENLERKVSAFDGMRVLNKKSDVLYIVCGSKARRYLPPTSAPTPNDPDSVLVTSGQWTAYYGERARQALRAALVREINAVEPPAPSILDAAHVEKHFGLVDGSKPKLHPVEEGTHIPAGTLLYTRHPLVLGEATFELDYEDTIAKADRELYAVPPGTRVVISRTPVGTLLASPTNPDKPLMHLGDAKVQIDSSNRMASRRSFSPEASGHVYYSTIVRIQYDERFTTSTEEN